MPDNVEAAKERLADLIGRLRNDQFVSLVSVEVLRSLFHERDRLLAELDEAKAGCERQRLRACENSETMEEFRRDCIHLNEQLTAMQQPSPCRVEGHKMWAWVEDHHHCCQAIETNDKLPCDCTASHCLLCTAERDGYLRGKQEKP